VNASPAYELTPCAACGSPDGREIAGVEDLRREVEMLWEFHGRRLRAETPPSRLVDRVAFSERPPIRLVACARCGLVYRNPIERAHELQETYTASAPSEDALRALHKRQRPAFRVQARRMRRILGRRGQALEVGSYVGAFLSAAHAEGLDVEGLDPNARVNRFTRSLGHRVHDGVLDTFGPGRAFDAVAIWNTFDQLPSPRAAAHSARGLLRAGGVLAVRVPNGELYAALRAALLKRSTAAAARLALAHSNLLTFPYRYGFNPRALGILLGSVGFEVLYVRGDVLVPLADEWTRPWARVEDWFVRHALAPVARLAPRWAPWVEVWARKA
jgi:2-polyprenyl-3-methyl-5-hydroxy-6-metoxy-1,4-benzoquinol methylase